MPRSSWVICVASDPDAGSAGAGSLGCGPNDQAVYAYAREDLDRWELLH